MVGRPYSEEFRRRVLEEVAEGNARRGSSLQSRGVLGDPLAILTFGPGKVALDYVLGLDRVSRPR